MILEVNRGIKLEALTGYAEGNQNRRLDVTI